MTNNRYINKISTKEIGISINKKDVLSVILFALLFIVIAQDGIIKYCLLAIGCLVLLVGEVKVNPDYFKIAYHALIYVAIGLFISLMRLDISYNSLKQLLIYLFSALFAICLYSRYGVKNPAKLVDNQFIGLMIAYLLMYARYFTLERFYFESNIYAYIFGVYALLYFYRKRYIKMALAIIFMLFDHKRIVDFAFIIAFICLLAVKLCKTRRSGKFINNLGCFLLIAVPILWVWLCRTGTLASIMVKLRINTMGRLEGTGAWSIASQYYVFSPSYTGRGIGWVLDWLQNANIGAFSNLHNDILVAYIELGFFGFLIWDVSFVFIIKWVSRRSLKISNFILVLTGFMFINFLTDNIYLYVTFLMPFYVILLAFIFGKSGKYKTENVRN